MAVQGQFPLCLLAIALAGIHGEIISDLTIGEFDETRALELKAEQFWGPILAAAEKAKMSEHAQLYADTEKVLSELNADHAYVKDALAESLSHLKHADELVLIDATFATKLASEEKRKPISDSKQGAFSFLTGGQIFSIFRDRLRRFASDGTYSERLVRLVEQRQAGVLPALRGTAEISGSVLSDCRTASKRGFDVLKYDIYSSGRLRGAPKTPENAKSIANRLVDAAGETRHHFMSSVTEMVSSIAKDAQGKHDNNAAATVTLASIDVQLKNSAGFGADLISSSTFNV